MESIMDYISILLPAAAIIFVLIIFLRLCQGISGYRTDHFRSEEETEISYRKGGR